MTSRKKIKIAIDGPAASGKSTTARKVARALNYLYIDSGALYRAVTLAALQQGVPVDHAPEVAELAGRLHFQFRRHGEEIALLMNGTDVSKDIRLPEITRNIHPVAANPAVRAALVEKLRELANCGGVVMDGRDIGTVVLPDAELKVYMEASPEERARRRVEELKQRGVAMDYQAVLDEILQRDWADQHRSHGPLKQAPDAIVIDTTRLSIAQQVEKIIQLAEQMIQKQTPENTPQTAGKIN